jgi:hypothetical protein
MEQSEPHRSSIEQIRKASDRAVSLTRQLLAFSRMQVLEPRVLNLKTLNWSLRPTSHWGRLKPTLDKSSRSL